jgi:hypothetical protein
MLLGFKRRFEPYVVDGSKQHTIRAIRAVVPRAGETCHCYVDPRQKTMRLLGRWECSRVQEIQIHASRSRKAPLVVSIDGANLSADEANQLFYRDGFRDEDGQTFTYMWQAANFWVGKLTFVGQLIHWRWTREGVAL